MYKFARAIVCDGMQTKYSNLSPIGLGNWTGESTNIDQ
jgi:hypothetical protein